jgi:SAM-dependent methyltransferase
MSLCREDLPPGICLFEEHWAEYDSWYQRNREIAESEVRAVAASLKGAPRPIVEVGVGTGFFAHRLGVDLGIDPAYNMLRVARQRRVESVQGVGEKPPLRRRSVGTALVIVTLCFAPDPRGLLRGVSEILRGGGRVSSCIIPRDSPWGQYYLELARQGDPFYSAARFYTVDEVREMYVETGISPGGCWSTISYTPHDKPRMEEPWPGCDGSFVCVLGSKKR